MAIAIRDVREHELDSVLALNNAAGPTILPLDSTKVRWFFDNADYFRVAEVDGHIAGFLIALRGNADYESPNYLWFRERYPAFLYIDRIVIAKPYRGLGLGRIFYSDATSYAEVRVPVLACEVFLEPRDDVSVLFHGTYGFHEVGQQIMPGLGKRVSLLAKDLPSFTFVRDTYLLGPMGQLPNQPWLVERVRNGSRTSLRAASGH
ncbi:GNAT family N-acetyltransferase [Tahibacter amnicola]|uniref:GNAT family N-acetyltransferase n=1 Tax=Tahibacter amnicola TaxID=2976241 RepID=A0ABY6BI91_9GAMM|nr:GNAT family N-acetyltransferase [Tahibacter amnicola]UXI69584.1 GNAT family N-acetyltransferase [Tahibacter amnicola]